MSNPVYFGWHLFYHYVFKQRLDRLEQAVTQLKKNLPFEEFRNHPEVNKLDKLYKTITDTVPRDPENPNFVLGKTLGRHKDWRRVKNSPAPRYRLFFKFFKDHAEIFYAWFNDENTLRKSGDKNDVYKVFKSMLERGDVPSHRDDLKKASHPLNSSQSSH